MAELHYKMAMTLQYMERPSEALVEVRTAIRVCEARIALLHEQRAQLGAPSNRDVAAESAAAPDSPSAAKAGEARFLDPSYPTDLFILVCGLI